MHTVKAAEPESIRRWLEGLTCINSKKWDKGETPERRPGGIATIETGLPVFLV